MVLQIHPPLTILQWRQYIAMYQRETCLAGDHQGPPNPASRFHHQLAGVLWGNTQTEHEGDGILSLHDPSIYDSMLPCGRDCCLAKGGHIINNNTLPRYMEAAFSYDGKYTTEDHEVNVQHHSGLLKWLDTAALALTPYTLNWAEIPPSQQRKCWLPCSIIHSLICPRTVIKAVPSVQKKGRGNDKKNGAQITR